MKAQTSVGLAVGLAGRVVYADTNVFIYALGQHTQWSERCLAVLQAASDRSLQLVAGELVLAELLVGPLRAQDHEGLASIRNLMQRSGLVELLAHTLPTFELAAKIRAENRLKMVDAIHVATALHHRADVFLTHDRGISTIPGLEVLSLD